MSLVRLVVCLGSAVLVTGCVSIQQMPLTPATGSELRNREITLAVRDKPDFSAMRSSTMALGGGLIAGAIMVSEGNRIVAENKIEDPALAISRVLSANLQQAYQARPTSRTARIADDDVAAAARQHADADLLLDMRTIGWSLVYFPTSWTRYRVLYSGRMRLIDVKRGQVIAEGGCSRVPEETPNAPTFDQLVADGAALLKREILLGAEECVRQLSTRVLAIASPTIGLASPAATAATAPRPFGTPLPQDLALNQPAPELPAGIAGLIGVWSGQWTNGLDHTLVVEKIDARKARLVYSWGVAPGGGEPGFTRVDAEITEAGALRANLATGAIVVYRLSPEGGALSGEWLREGRTFSGTLARRQIEGLALTPYVAPKVVRAADFAGSWIGRFEGGPRAVMTIENIQGRSAVLVYSFEVTGRQYRGSPDKVHGRTEAALADDGSLQATLANGAKVVYRVADDGSLAGEYARDNQHYQGRFHPPARSN